MALTTEQFLETYGTRTGRWLANRLNLSGKGSEGMANLLSAYAWNKRAAETLTKLNHWKGRDGEPNAYHRYCSLLRQDIEAHAQWETVRRRVAFW